MLKEGLFNWKLRLILSALLCIGGLAAMISMVLGTIVDLTVYDKTIVAVAIFMVGVPAYLIVSGLARIDEKTIARFLNETLSDISENIEVLAMEERELTDKELEERSKLEAFFEDSPVYKHLPDKPVKQAYVLMLFSLIVSFAIWYLT